MIPESKPGKTEHGLLPKGDGWFVLNMRDAVWRHADGRGAVCLVLDDFENAPQAEQLGVNPFVLNPGEPMAMYHWEADQEDFLILSGEAVLVIEGAERRLRAWDFVHCPVGANHVIVGAGTGPCAVLCVGVRDRSTGPDWGGYTADPAAIRHGAGVEEDTTDPDTAYARFPARRPSRYRDGWLPDPPSANAS